MRASRPGFDGVHPLVSRILRRRGITTSVTAWQFLHPDSVYHGPQLLSGMEDAVERINAAIYRQEQIVVYGDFDADGITATVLLVESAHRGRRAGQLLHPGSRRRGLWPAQGGAAQARGKGSERFKKPRYHRRQRHPVRR